MDKILGNSKFVMSNQDGPHSDLALILSRYSLDNYQRPVASFSQKLWLEILEFIGNSKVIFDLGCGIGESSVFLYKKYPDCKIIGIDKSLSRIDRKNKFKEDLASNIFLCRGELLDLIPLIYKSQSELKIEKIYLLYPNPWPKKIHVKRRFHANPVAPFLFNIDAEIIYRSNWRTYLEEVEICAKLVNGRDSKISLIKNPEFITPFEKKYFDSGQEIYEISVLQGIKD